LNARRADGRCDYLSYATGDVKRLAADDPIERDRNWKATATRVFASDTQTGDQPASPSNPGNRRMLGEFELISRLGRGGMGVVYRAWQPSLGRQVALKCLLRYGDAKAEARFAREIRALGRVEHPNVVKVFTSGAEADQWFYAMELLEGADLGAVCA